MELQLKERLWKYIIKQNPELMFSLQEDYAAVPYINEKINSIKSQLKTWEKIGYPEPSIHLLAMEVLTSDLKPSRFQFISNILKNKFPVHYNQYKSQGILAYKTISLVELCKEAFDSIRFSEAHFNSKRFKEAISGIIRKQILLNNAHQSLVRPFSKKKHENI